MSVASGNQTASAGGLTKGARITGDQRSSLAEAFGARYAGGESIRSIAQDTGRSYGFVHGVLKESGATLRGRGGATRGPRRDATEATTAEPPGDAVPAPASPARTKAKAAKDKADKDKVDKDKVDKVAEKAGKAKSSRDDKDDKGKKKADAKKSAKKGKKG